MKDYMKSRFAIILYAVIVLLIVTVVSLIISMSSKTTAYNKNLSDKEKELSSANATISEYSSTIKENASQIDKYKSDAGKMQSEIESISSENASLKSQLTELADKKAARTKAQQQKAKAEAQKKADKASAETTKKIKAVLTLPKEKQAKQLKNVCYLTFDDGPSKHTPKVLDILKKYNVKATFFVIGTGDMTLLKRMEKEGHAIGLHSNSHEYSYIYSSTKNYLLDLQSISKKVEKQIGKKVQIIRFPGGSNNLVSKKYNVGIMTKLSKMMPEMGYNYIDWNVCAGDADRSGYIPASEITSNTLSRAKGKSSICVLLHDASAKKTTVEALPKIIEGLTKMGYRFEVITPSTNGYHFKVAN